MVTVTKGGRYLTIPTSQLYFYLGMGWTQTDGTPTPPGDGTAYATQADLTAMSTFLQNLLTGYLDSTAGKEQLQDQVAAFLVGGTYNDALNTYTLPSGGAGSTVATDTDGKLYFLDNAVGVATDTDGKLYFS